MSTIANNGILIGSRAFFQGIKGFRPNDTDMLYLEDNPEDYNYVKQIRICDNCEYHWKNMPKEDFISYALSNGPAMQLGKFLVPAFVEAIGFTIEDLKQLRPLADNLDDKHKYEKIIYDSYIENNEFTLTDEQLQKAYLEYKNNKRK